MRNILATAAMAAMVCVIGCDKLSTTGSQGHVGPKGEKGDKGDPGDTTAYGKDCKTDAECGNAGKCGTAKFCRSFDSDELTATVRKRREAEVKEAEEVLRKADEALTEADEICADTTGDCKVADEAERHVRSAEKQIKRAKDQLALVTPVAPTAEPPKAEPPKAEATAKAGEKKDEKVADKPAGKKPPAAKPPEASAKADAVEGLKTEVGLLTGKVGDIEGRTDGLEDNQKTLFGKTSKLVVAVGALGKKIEAKPEASPVKPSDTRIFDDRRFSSCVKAREADVFVGEGLTAEDRKTKIENDCRAKQAG